MRKIFRATGMLVTMLLCFGMTNTQVRAAEVPVTAEYFPQEWMRNLLATQTNDKNTDGILSDTEIQGIKTIEYEVTTGQSITSLKGIEHLSALESVVLKNMVAEELYLEMGELKSLRLKNPQIEKLKITNDLLDSFTVEDGGYITKIDLSGCSNLTQVNCNYEYYGLSFDDPVTVISSLNVSNCSKMRWLHIEKSGLSEIKLSGCNSLRNLNCPSNNLTKLNISDCSNLEYLNFNDNKIKKINFKCCKKLKTIRGMNNRLKQLDLRGNKKLFWCTFTGNKIKTLKLPNIDLLNEEGENDLPADYEMEIISSFARNKINNLDISAAKNLKKITRKDIKRFFTGDYVRRKYSDAIPYTKRAIYIDLDEDEKVKKCPIKKIIISKELQEKDRKWIAKQAEKYEVKVVVR